MGKALAWLWAHAELLAIVITLIVAAFVLGQCDGRRIGADTEKASQQRETIKVQAKVGTANEKAAGERVTDTLARQQQQQELRNAQSMGAAGDDRRRRSGCVILRQQGRDPASIPACRRPEGPGGAGVSGSGVGPVPDQPAQRPVPGGGR